MIPAHDRKNEEGWVPVPGKTISINRAPVLTLWAAVVPQRLGFDEGESLTGSSPRQPINDWNGS
jgi:hypothetical protein